MNQIASFYPGAMVEDRQIDLGELAGQVDLVLIGASDPDAMLAFTKQCISSQIPFAADTSWQLARLDGEQVRTLMTGADYLFCNEYEATLTEHKTGWSTDDLNDRVGVRVTTLGGHGARIDRAGHSPIVVPAVPGVEPKEPTGAGDAFRSGFLAAVSWGLGLERAAQLGNMVAAHVLETTGTQEYQLAPEPLARRFTAAYGAVGGRRYRPGTSASARARGPAAGVAATAEHARSGDGLPAMPGAEQCRHHRLDGHQVHELPVDHLLQRQCPQRPQPLAIQPQAYPQARICSALKPSQNPATLTGLRKIRP